MCLYPFLVYTGPNHIDIKLNGHVVNGYMQGVFLPAPLVSTEIKKVSEQPEDLFKELKISMEQQLYLAPWPFFITILYMGGAACTCVHSGRCICFQF